MKYLERREEMRQEFAKYYKEKTNLRLKYAALIMIGMSVVLMIVMIVEMNQLSRTALLIMRGVVGVLAIIFAILVTVLMYRVCSSYIADKYKSKSNKFE